MNGKGEGGSAHQNWAWAGGAEADRELAHRGRRLGVDGQLRGTVALDDGSLPEKLWVARAHGCGRLPGLPTDGEL
jgi:hypothetical protein